MSSLVINDLSCQRGYNQLFSNLSFQVNVGEVLHITGTNGSGKTSLLKILAGVSAREHGEISWNQHSVKSEEYRQEVFYLGHQAALSGELSSLENLEFLSALNKSTDQQQLIQALGDIGLKGYKDEYCANLSAGQKRRVILAGLFVSKAKIWLLDEPFTALDPTGVKIVESRIEKHCNNGGLCLFTTHQDSALANQRVLAL
ncbi:ABC transporter involved in cytochrome c biogenesis, ATPase component CcmA [uncultured Gammaproteobacteria bacterium]|uniref:cytochrome c biogenesis heme-transporting ATPase CcmA n=1 Tax=Bathymodiolus heckerae thiotrophic gill symbiont TaxID=1052212 RepID=UPI0010B5551F|nr:cytochrome c biogenesis heme-transporting ATPase CcmA [Bathymodiolus heckerae thiotrophic gill symbiont]CAC9536082.1 ABC transporter involved in cytochrome c biogenesis, ATPase component CcmA [uncultured Gammaproteobacteria bacterium]CAC9587974.1 ABC transporter involved in cytochrome c biogenesis, ATPase component CcmA [uncultured Gammaproteobacteria bacterium]CAC9952310.1 ABC transporter involved in cytochrome c biogenesis, ATPase component CcmA [uncultured Gammaproteobacteria bacterium]CA